MQTFDLDELELSDRLGPQPACPPLHLLMAAHEGVLPAGPQESLQAHLAECGLCNLLLRDLDALPAVPFTAAQQQRVRLTLPETPSGQLAVPIRAQTPWRSIALIAAALLITAGGFVALRGTHQHSPAPSSAAQLQAPAAPVEIAIAKLPPPLGLAPGLTLRGAASEGEPTTAELMPAFTAYNQDQYETAAERFGSLVQLFPASALPRLYLGVTQLLLHQDQQAFLTLSPTSSIQASAYTDSISWYRAAAAVRTQRPEARQLFDTVCKDQSSLYRGQACEIEQKLPEH